MHCLEASKSDAQSIFEPVTIALFHSVVWSGCLGFFLTLWDPEYLKPEQHSWLQAMLRAAHLQGAHVGFFFPHPCPAQLEDSYIQLCQELATHCYWSTSLAADAKPRIFCCTDPQLGEVESISFADIITLAKLSVSGSPHSGVPLRNFQPFLPQCFCAKRPAVCDGAGLFSNADNMSTSTAQAHAPMKEAAKDILAYLRQHNLVRSIAQHLREHKETEPLSEHHGAVIAEIIRRKVDPECSTEHCLAISPGQPFRLTFCTALRWPYKTKTRSYLRFWSKAFPRELSILCQAASNGHKHRTALTHRRICKAHTLSTAGEIGPWQSKALSFLHSSYNRKSTKAL